MLKKEYQNMLQVLIVLYLIYWWFYIRDDRTLGEALQEGDAWYGG